ncbi:MAG: cytochrome c [Helicobacteraceae bacterium]|jgi:mono/diheme cytochrome c family protein|nr:cytochrome c [Helicobacteraceae bacterium]
MKHSLLLSLAFYASLLAQEMDGKKVFETYCWGCHHQTAVAFGPPFNEIASKRSLEEIEAYIIEPEAMYKAFGYKRTVMTKIDMSEQERHLIARYILSFKGKK